MARPPLPPAEPMKLVPLAEIAKGGMGSVQLARAEGGRLNGNVLAIKRLHANIAQDPQFVGMFLDEAWMTAALKSPNVVQVAAWGEDEQGMFLAVELVQGVSLSRLIKESRENKEPFAERTVAFLGSQICAGMAAAHALRGQDGKPLGLVHRDLTPGNVLVSFDGIVKIADFGIAKAEERITHTRTGTLKGKPAYMAPEQARGGKVDGRADIFSFGVVMFELLAGRRPWMAKGTFEVMMEAATDPTPDLSTLRRGVNPSFLEIVNRCLAKKPDDRWSAAEEIQTRLDAWRRAKGFAGDDLASLAHFVRRNSVRQIAWFEQALRGDYAQGGAPTFKEIEERIDQARKGSSGAMPAVRPAAGARAAPPPVPSSPGARAAPPPVPSSPGAAAPTGRDALRSLNAKPPKPFAASLGALPAPGEPTARMEGAADPFSRTMAVEDQDVEIAAIGPESTETTTIADPRFQKLAQPAPNAPSAGPRLGLGGTALMQPSPWQLPPGAPRAPNLGPPPAPPPPPGYGPPAAPALAGPAPLQPVYAGAAPGIAAARPPRPSRAGTIVLLVTLPLIGAGAFATWRFRDRIFGGSRGTPSAEPAPPSSAGPAGR